MKNLSLKNIAKACNGKLYNCDGIENVLVSDVVIDSRKVTEGCLFIPIKGARVDGHDFIPQVLADGAVCVLSQYCLDTDKPYIQVLSTTQALMDIAAFYRQSLDIKVIGITGSVGKTSTKEMIASVLEEKFKVLKTEGNFNNEIGLPLTIFRLREEHKIAVLEMGISHFGDMEKLAVIAKPDICVITNIGICHLENLSNRNGVLKAKTEMFKFMADNGAIILNGDDDKLITIDEYNGIKPIFYGMNKEFALYGENVMSLGLKGTFFTVNFMNGESLEIYVRIPGKHMVYNSMAAAAVGEVLGMNPDEIKKGIEKVRTVKGRNNVVETKHLTIIDDCYNANPVSTKAAIDVLTYAHGRKVAILGDMFELGSEEIQMHREVGEYAAEKNVDLLICIGELSKNTYDAAMENGIKKAVYYKTKEEFLEKPEEVLQKSDNILVKASHGMEFPEVVNKLLKM